MRAVIQRVETAEVRIGKDCKNIGKGFLVLVAAAKGDSEKDARYLARKIANLRIMADNKDKMNKTLQDVGGEALVVSQFTLYARTRKGNRPSFTDAADAGEAEKLYRKFIKFLKDQGLPVKTGEFGRYMQVSLVNDGPVTLIIDSSDRNKPRKRH